MKCETTVDDMIVKYKEWSEILIKPQTLNDSRLFAVEARIIEEEKVRLNEFKMMQESIRKLIYTLG